MNKQSAEINKYLYMLKNKDLLFLIIKEIAKETRFDLKTKSQDDIKEFIDINMDVILIKFQQKNIEFMKNVESNKSKVINYLIDMYF